MLVATGRGPQVEGIGLEAAGVDFDPRRASAPTRRMRTNVAHIYAVGDCAGRWQLAHTAFREGEVAAENALGHDAEIDYSAVPRCIYTDPEVAAVGLTEAAGPPRRTATSRRRPDAVLGLGPGADVRRADRAG